MRYTGKDSKNALKVGAWCFGAFFLFNKAIPSLLITSGKVLGKKEEPQHLYNEGLFLASGYLCCWGALAGNLQF